MYRRNVILGDGHTCANTFWNFSQKPEKQSNAVKLWILFRYGLCNCMARFDALQINLYLLYANLQTCFQKQLVQISG